MKIRIFVLVSCIISTPVFAQDYFEDLRGNGNPITINVNKTFNVNARLNLGDNSVKANIFKIVRFNQNLLDTDLSRIQRISNLGGDPEDFSNSAEQMPPPSSFTLNDFGLGTSIKGKTKEGLGTLFSKSDFSNESQIGLYGVFHRVKILKDKHKYTFVLSPFLNFNFSALRTLPDTSLSFQKLDTTMNQSNFGISGFVQFYIKQKSQFIVGASITHSTLNNYDDLGKGELKEFVTRVDNIGRTLTTIEDKGYTYAIGSIKEYKNTKLRVHFTLIPRSIDYRVGIVLYPSIDLNNLYKESLKNIGLGFHFLEKGNPTISSLGLFFELNDINNAREKTDPFIKRSFKVGLSTALNVTSLIKKEK